MEYLGIERSNLSEVFWIACLEELLNTRETRGDIDTFLRNSS